MTASHELQEGPCKLQATLRGYTGFITRLSWSPDGRLLATASSDGTVRLWDTEKGESSRVLETDSSLLYSVAWSPDGKFLASGSVRQEVQLWVR